MSEYSMQLAWQTPPLRGSFCSTFRSHMSALNRVLVTVLPAVLSELPAVGTFITLYCWPAWKWLQRPLVPDSLLWLTSRPVWPRRHRSFEG